MSPHGGQSIRKSASWQIEFPAFDVFFHQKIFRGAAREVTQSKQVRIAERGKRQDADMLGKDGQFILARLDTAGR